MSNQVYANSLRPYTPVSQEDVYTVSINYNYAGQTIDNTIGIPLALNVCNGVAGTVIAGVTTYENGQKLSTQVKYFGKNDPAYLGGGTVFTVVKSGHYRLEATACFDTPGTHQRGLGVKILPASKDRTAIPLRAINTIWSTTGVGTGTALSVSTVQYLEAGQFFFFAVYNDDTTDILATDRGISTHAIVAEVSLP